MTKRLQYPNFWAESGTATDPDLDTTHPSYEADKYEQHGWHSEKPPEQWQNFLSQITDEKIIAKMVDGLPYFDSSVAYQDGALYRKNDKFYVIVSGVEQEVIEFHASVYNSLVAGLNTLLSDHLAADNPHQDTVDTLIGGGYTKTAVDNFFGDPNDPKTVVYHTNIAGATVHGETAVSIGALPAATGGTFTGDVIFLEGALFQVTPSKYLHFNKSTALLELVSGTYSLGIDAAGNGYIVGTSGTALMLSELNIDSLTIKYNNSFALPTPLFSLNLETSLSDGDSIGNWIIGTATDPVFEDGKGYVTQATNALTGVNVPSEHTVFVRGYNTANVVYVYDVASSKSYADLNELVNSGVASVTNIKQVVIYPTLTAYQKTMLVNS